MKIVNILVIVIGNFFENAGCNVIKGAGMADQKMLNELNVYKMLGFVNRCSIHGLKMLNCEKFKKD